MWTQSKAFEDETLKKSKAVTDLIEYIKVVGGPGADHLIIEELDKRLKKINARAILKTLTDVEKKQLSSMLTVVNFYFNKIRELQKYSTILLLLKKEIRKNCTDRNLVDELEILKESTYIFSKKITINKKQKLRYKSITREVDYIKDIKKSIDELVIKYLFFTPRRRKDKPLKIEKVAWLIKKTKAAIADYKGKILFHAEQLEPLFEQFDEILKDAEKKLLS
jgi:hypothetical protein